MELNCQGMEMVNEDKYARESVREGKGYDNRFTREIDSS